MTKIFQLELFVKEMKLWEMPANGSHNGISMEVTAFDCKDVPIKCVKVKSDVKGSGQNFLFTLNDIPTDENQVFFNIFRHTNKKKLLGTGNIPIHEFFGDVFLDTFKATEIVQQPQDNGNDQGPAEAIEDNKTVKNNSETVHSITQQNSKNNLKTAQANRQQDTKNNSKTAQPTNQQDTKNNSKTTQPNRQQNKATKNDSKSMQKMGDNAGKANVADNKNQQSQKTNDTTISDATVEDLSMENTENPNTSTSFPISRLTKDIYPIIGTDSNQCGVVCILMRLTSFGSFSAHPIHIHQNHKEIIVQNTENTALYRRVPLDELRNNRHYEDFRFISAFPSNTGREELVYSRGPKVKDFSYQCNEEGISKDMLQRNKSLEDQVIIGLY